MGILQEGTLTRIVLCLAILASTSLAQVNDGDDGMVQEAPQIVEQLKQESDLEDLLLRTQDIANEKADAPFMAKVTCLNTYKVQERVKCRFDITNMQDQDYYLLKWHTPLEGVRSSCLSVTKDGKELAYDGMKIKRGSPSSRRFVLVRGGSTLSTQVDLSYAYAMNTTGTYTVQLQSTLQYCPVTSGVPCRKSSRQMRDIPDTQEKEDELHVHEMDATSTSATFQLVGSGVAPKTLGEHYRQLAATNQEVYGQQAGTPRDPAFMGGTAAERELTKEIHRASYHYLSVANTEIDTNQTHYVAWFGAVDATRMSTVKRNFRQMKSAFENTVYTYVFDDPRCKPDEYGFTFDGSTNIYLCAKYTPSSDLIGIDTKLCTVVHELSHAKVETDDHKYGRRRCLNFATRQPQKAIDNADNYCYFIETTNPFDYGIDSVAKLPNSKAYVTKGNFYLRYTDDSASTIADDYPRLIKGNWGALPDAFLAGFDSMTTLRDGKTYVTKGSQYVRYSDSSASTVDAGYPKVIQGNWGNVPSSFATGFDSMTVLPNNKAYATKGNQYIRYSDNSASTVDAGFPKSLQTNFGTLNTKFAAGFDSLAQLKGGKTYATKNTKYIRYSDAWASTIDSGYPKPIRGNWGTLQYPGPH